MVVAILDILDTLFAYRLGVYEIRMNAGEGTFHAKNKRCIYNVNSGYIYERCKTLRKNAYLNLLKILPPKNENFQMKNSDMFSYFCSKHRLWVLVSTALARRF